MKGRIMARYHVKADGSMGICTARDGNCPFGDDEGTKHFASEAEARIYSERLIKDFSTNVHWLANPVRRAQLS